ncbi:hypothetical protein GF343_02125 [Candidatus Woesearchaeota archaeon]|nr:hypothetical protein [Candidatus Woesearchaeota archaeon]
MKKSLLTIILVILIILIVLCGGLLALIILGESVGDSIKDKLESGELRANRIQIDCLTCNNNPLDVQECISFLQENKDNPQIAGAGEYGFDIDNIQHVEKRVMLMNFNDLTVRCIYRN